MNRIRGFTLLELSIVIVIIGLIVAGISAGQSLVRQAQLRGITSQQSEYKVAVNSFLLQYDAYPGDFNNASSYWPSCDGTPANCNGDNDGLITYSGPSAPNRVESVRSWQHLSLAGLVEGTYTGLGQGCGSYSNVPGVNIPAADFPHAGGYTASGWMLWTGMRKFSNIVISLGSYDNCWGPFRPILTPAETQSIDLKMDDGVPRSGAVVAKNSGNLAASEVNCYTGGSYDAGGDYTLSNSNAGCHIGFIVK